MTLTKDAVPDLTGPHGRAWRQHMEGLAKRSVRVQWRKTSKGARLLNVKIGRLDVDIDRDGHIVGAGTDVSRVGRAA